MTSTNDDTALNDDTAPNDDTAFIGRFAEPAEPVDAAEPAERPDSDAEDPDNDLAAALAKAAPRRWWNRGTLALGGVAVLAAGFLGGVLVEKNLGATPAPTARGGFGGGFRAAGGAGFGGYGQPGGQPGGGPPTAAPTANGATGTVKLVDGTTIYLQTESGTLVTVKTNAKTAVRAATRATLKDVHAGDSVTVVGSTGSDATLTATAVTATAR